MSRIRRRSGTGGAAGYPYRRGTPSDPTKPKKLQIVGFKNSGKTTLAETLLRLALDRGWRTSAIKHHGHGGLPALPPSNTDTSRFFEAGASSSVVIGGGMVLLQGRQPEEPDSLSTWIRLAEASARPDLILIEGFKYEDYPKIVLVRCPEDWAALKTLKNIILIVAASDALARQLIQKDSGRQADPRVLSREQSEHLADWFADWLKGESDESL